MLKRAGCVSVCAPKEDCLARNCRLICARMFASLITRLTDWDNLLTNPLVLVMTVFQIWMLVHAIRNREWIWALFIAIGWGLSALLYYFMVYRATPSSTRGFELPGAQSRKRIKELQAQIHHLDKAHHHLALGDVYFSQGKLDKAEASYRASIERDSKDLDARAHLGQCLLRLKRPAEARPLLEAVVTENPKHDYGHTMMALAETLTALGETDNAVLYWEHITQNHSYPRAKVQLAELYLAKNQPEKARAELHDVLADDPHTPAFQRKRDRVWVSRAKTLLGKLPA
ncbi:MAG: tetratricopeptide repeat protein [Verrucomicrobia bacterium]|nr:MAG: tetratricopeptide repeat protein [Verrucomicrobiota bacterium]